MSQPSTRSAVSTILPTGLMLFALFFGAGNLIFPPLLGAASGRSFIPVMVGFLATGVLMPLITVVAVSTSGEGILGLARRVGPRFGAVMPLAVYLAIGPLYAIARVTTVAYELATRPVLELLGIQDSRLASPEEAEDEGWDTAVVVPGLDGPRAALSVEIAGPHTVVALGEEGELEAAAFAGLTDSADPVAYDPAPEVGTNLELVVPLGEETDPDTQSSVGIARMRVLERGMGETLSYGAGCCAVAVALHAWTGPGAPEDYRLLVPGGEIGVHVGSDPLGEDSSVLLTGPAAITARITVA